MKIESTFQKYVQWLDSRGVMPTKVPTLEPMEKALRSSGILSKIDPKKVIVVAGTNGKGSTSATLETLLMATGARVGLYTSPHLVECTERVRINQKDISKQDFIRIFEKYRGLIETIPLSHFEFFTLLAADYFFLESPVDWAIFEVGLGGKWDATNAIPHETSVITVLGLDHQNFLGNTLVEIAGNKFGIVRSGNLVVHQKFEDISVKDLARDIEKETRSQWFVCEPYDLTKEQGPGEPLYGLRTKWGQAEILLPGERGAQNTALALTVFEKLGFNPTHYLPSLKSVKWPGRMQKMTPVGFACPVYLSGDHNPQGMDSLMNLLKDYRFQNLHAVIGIGKDKEADKMLADFLKLKNAKIYLTVTPFKGRALSEYPAWATEKAQMTDASLSKILTHLREAASDKDMILITGSLYLVGEALKILSKS